MTYGEYARNLSDDKLIAEHKEIKSVIDNDCFGRKDLILEAELELEINRRELATI